VEVVYILGGFFLALGAAMLYVAWRSRLFGILLMGVTYSAAGATAIWLAHWWPLAAGFALVWILKLLGLEPRIETRNDGER
jgi:hypothetical protein